MQTNFETVIVDTSCLFLLSKINELDIIKHLFKNVLVTKIISLEFEDELPVWFQIIDNSSDKMIDVLNLEVDKGESSAFALALNYHNSLLIIDDLKARKFAKKLSLDFVGTIGILIKSISTGLIQDCDELIKKIKATDFRISEELLGLLKISNK